MLITFEIGSDRKQIIDRLVVLRPPKGNHQDLLICLQVRVNRLRPKLNLGGKEWTSIDSVPNNSRALNRVAIMFKSVHLKSQAFSAAIPISSNHALLRARLRCKHPIVINTREHFSKVRVGVESDSIHTDIGGDHDAYLRDRNDLRDYLNLLNNRFGNVLRE